jgi:hypothetical protein
VKAVPVLQRSVAGHRFEFVNEVDETFATQPGDLPIWTLGGALPLGRPTNDLASERAQLRDVEFLVDRLCRLSAGGPTFVIEYDGEEVGVVADGDADASLRQGLLAEWRRRVQGP